MAQLLHGLKRNKARTMHCFHVIVGLITLLSEMDAALSAFRRSVQSSWIRRVIRALTSDRTPSALARLTPGMIASIRDTAWEARETAYVRLTPPLPSYVDVGLHL